MRSLYEIKKMNQEPPTPLATDHLREAREELMHVHGCGGESRLRSAMQHILDYLEEQRKP